MATERFTYEEAIVLPEQDSEPPTAEQRLRSMTAILNVLERGGIQVEQARDQLASLARGILGCPRDERKQVNSTIKSYLRSRYEPEKELGRNLRREIRSASNATQLRLV